MCISLYVCMSSCAAGCHRFVCSLVEPLVPPRELVNPRASARFVSLIPFKRDTGLLGRMGGAGRGG